MRYDLSEYSYIELEDILRKRDDAKEFMEAILDALYSKDPLPDLFEMWVEELANYHGLKIPSSTLKIEKKNESLQQIQFLLGKVLT